MGARWRFRCCYGNTVGALGAVMNGPGGTLVVVGLWRAGVGGEEACQWGRVRVSGGACVSAVRAPGVSGVSVRPGIV